MFDNKLLMPLTIALVLAIVFLLYTNMFNTQENMSSLWLEKYRITLYYAEWCGYSKKMMPIWLAFKKQAKRVYPQLLIDEVDCSGGTPTDPMLHIVGYPTIIMRVPSMGPVTFEGERSIEGLQNFVHKYIRI